MRRARIGIAAMGDGHRVFVVRCEELQPPGRRVLRTAVNQDRIVDAGDVIRFEATWKERLHTRQPFGLNEN